MAISADPAARHREVAAIFTEKVQGAADAQAWAMESPVDGWTAKDVVRHLIDWLPGLLSSGTPIKLPKGPSVDSDPVGAWTKRTAAVQQLLDDPATAELTYSSPMMGEMTVVQLIDQFYSTDIFMHTWDLARATIQDDRLDAEHAAQLLAGMREIEPMLRESGQFGVQQEVAADADATDQLIAFIGRDPYWHG